MHRMKRDLSAGLAWHTYQNTKKTTTTTVSQPHNLPPYVPLTVCAKKKHLTATGTKKINNISLKSHYLPFLLPYSRKLMLHEIKV